MRPDEKRLNLTYFFHGGGRAGFSRRKLQINRWLSVDSAPL